MIKLSKINVSLFCSMFLACMPLKAHALNFSWSPPSLREDSKALQLNEISKFKLLISTAAGQYDRAQAFTTVANETALKVETLPAGTYYAVVTATDIYGLESKFSNEISFAIAEVIQPTPTPTGSVTPTPTPTPAVNPPSKPPTGSPSATPTATPTPDDDKKPACFSAQDFNGDCKKDTLTARKSSFSIKLSNSTADVIKGKIAGSVIDKMIGYGRFTVAQQDQVMYLRLPKVSLPSSTTKKSKILLEWISVDPYTKSEQTVLSFGKLGDRPIFGCYDSAFKSIPVLQSKLANGKTVLYAKIKGVTRRFNTNAKAASFSCIIDATGTSYIQSIDIKGKLLNKTFLYTK